MPLLLSFVYFGSSSGSSYGSSSSASSGFGSSFGASFGVGSSSLLPTIFLSIEDNTLSHGPMLCSTCMFCMDSRNRMLNVWVDYNYNI
jgi:hypothetical protein